VNNLTGRKDESIESDPTHEKVKAVLESAKKAIYNGFMNKKAPTTFLVVSILVASDIAERIELPPREHIHADLHTESVAAIGSYMTKSGRTLRPVLRKTLNDVVGDTFMYEADLPFAVTVQIIHHINRGTGWQLCWQLRRITLGVCGPWAGKFATAQEAALAA
jgi:hypothetical protein